MAEGDDLPSGIVTFVFTDIEGSTRLLRRLGERYSEVLDRHLDLMGQAWTRHGGQLIGTAGDGVFVAFQDPTQAAVTACAEAQRLLCAEPGRPTARCGCGSACTAVWLPPMPASTGRWPSTKPQG